MQHFAQQNAILILNLLKPFSLLQFFFIVILNMLWFWWLSHINLRFDITESLHVHDMLLDLLAVRDDSI